jgi:putative ABC transport system substrate-binding protein
MRGLQRGLFLLAAAALLAAPLGAEAQQAGKTHRIGAIHPCIPPGTTSSYPVLRQALHDLGYVEGRNLTLDRECFQCAEQAPEIIRQFLEHKVDVIVAWSGPGATAAKKLTSTVPIVFIDPADPIGIGLVASLARPGGNATGISSMASELATKRLQLLKEAAPRAARVVVLANPTNQSTPSQLEGVDDAARALGVKLRVLKIRTSAEIDEVFLQVIKERPDAALVLADPMFFTEQDRIVGQAARARVPTMYSHTNFAMRGGLLAYAPNLPDMSPIAAGYVDKILKGAQPADLPVQQPTRFDLVINLKTAKQLGITVPQTILLRAERVIE